MPDHAPDPIDNFAFDEYAFINQEIAPISTIEHDLFVNEPKFLLRGLGGLRGSKYKLPINAIVPGERFISQMG
jgi:hypothetical protein